VEDYAAVYIPDRCIGCRACQVACKLWNGRRPVETSFSPTFTNPVDLGPETYTIVKYIEAVENGEPKWVFLKTQCMHCENPACAAACPAHAIEVHEGGAVVIREDKCIGCRFCIDACPFNIPRYDPSRNKVYKCTFCIDRIQNGLEPACVSVCPTRALMFGPRSRLVSELKGKGYEVYGDSLPGVGSTHWLYATRKYKGRLTDPKWFGLPAAPRPKPAALRPEVAAGGLGAAAIVAAGCLAHLIYWRIKRMKEKGEA